MSMPLITTELVEFSNEKITLFFVVIIEENSLCFVFNGLGAGEMVFSRYSYLKSNT